MIEAFALAFGLAFFLGIRKGIRTARANARAKAVQTVTSGWLYFAAGSGTEVKVGVTEAVPTKDDLPDAPVPMRFVYRTQVDDTDAALAEMERDIGAHRTKTGWYDRDAAMYYIDRLKGVA